MLIYSFCLLSLTAIGSVFFGDQKEIFYISFHLMLFGSNYVPVRIQFELSVLVSLIVVCCDNDVNYCFF